MTTVRFLNISIQDFLCPQICPSYISYETFIFFRVQKFCHHNNPHAIGHTLCFVAVILNCHLHSRGWKTFRFLEAGPQNLNKNGHSQYCLFLAAWWVCIETRFIKCSTNYTFKKKRKGDIFLYGLKLVISHQIKKKQQNISDTE